MRTLFNIPCPEPRETKYRPATIDGETVFPVRTFWENKRLIAIEVSLSEYETLGRGSKADLDKFKASLRRPFEPVHSPMVEERRASLHPLKPIQVRNSLPH